MAVKKEDVLEAIASMSVMEVVDLIAAMEEKFGVSAAPVAAPVAVASADDEVSSKVVEKDSFDVVLTAVGGSKVAVIKAVRSFTGLGLKEAKEKVDSAPSVLREGVPKEEGERLLKELQDAGASGELK